jgi:DNA-binding response OmpR family regulator
MKDKPSILVVDDDPNISRLEQLYLEKEGCEVRVAADGRQAVEEFRRLPPDLILLDVMLPGMDGYEVLKTVRKSGNIPVIMVTARGETFDKVLCLELGAEDYITKPFGVQELLARVSALLRRTGKSNREQNGNSDALVSGRFTLDLKSHVLRKGDVIIDLTSVEFSIMELFFRNEGVALTREKILEGVWGENYYGDIKIVDVNIRRLRMKIEDDASNPQYIITVWGYGYRWGL